MAIIDLNELEEPLGHRDIPNGPTLADPSKFNPRAYDRKVDRILASNARRHAKLCEALETLLNHYVDADGTQAGAWELEIASRIDTMDRPGCLGQAVSAVPEGQAGDELFERMRFICVGSPWTGVDHCRDCNRFNRNGASLPLPKGR